MNKAIVLTGPTAVGKTELAIDIARKFGGKILNCDSMQIYKYMDIGSAKPTPEERRAAVHHLIDFVDPGEEFSVAKYACLARAELKKMSKKNILPVISGGTGLYINSIIYNMDFAGTGGDEELRKELYREAEKKGNDVLYDRLCTLNPELASTLHANNTQRLVRALERVIVNSEPQRKFEAAVKKNKEYDFILICINRDRQELYDRINLRVDKLFEEGLVDEVSSLISYGYGSKNISMKGIGYKEVIGYLEGKYSLDESISLVKRNTRRFAKRQLTWFKRYEDMIWFDLSDGEKEKIFKYIEDELSRS